MFSLGSIVGESLHQLAVTADSLLRVGPVVGQLDPMAFVGSISPTWGWLLLFAWVSYQLYWPFWQTKVQAWHGNVTARFHRIEIGQINLAELNDDADEERYRDLHAKSSLTTRDLKDLEDSKR